MGRSFILYRSPFRDHIRMFSFSLEEQWSHIKNAILQASWSIPGFSQRKNQDFDEINGSVQELVEACSLASLLGEEGSFWSRLQQTSAQTTSRSLGPF